VVSVHIMKTCHFYKCWWLKVVRLKKWMLSDPCTAAVRECIKVMLISKASDINYFELVTPLKPMLLSKCTGCGMNL
jgi:hypothetical protein